MEPVPTSAPGRRRGPMLAAIGVAVAILAGVALVLAVTGDEGDEGGDRLADPGAEVEAPSPDTAERDAPDDSFEYWDGQQGSLGDFAGQPVVLNFFASWCVPCVDEMPEFEAVHQDLGDQVRFVGVNQRDQRSAAESIIDRTGITYEVVRDDGTLLEALEGLIMPTTVFITADGRVVRVHSGQMDAEQLRTAIDEELLA